MKNRVNLICGAAILSAFVLRLWGINFGLPFRYHPDEHSLTYRALEALSHQGNPNWFEYPGFCLYLNALSYSLMYGLGRLEGRWQTGGEFWQAYLADKTAFILVGRLWSVIWGVGSVVLIMKIAKDWFGEKVAPWAGWFLATNFLAVRESHFATADSALAFWSMFALWQGMRASQRSSFFVAMAMAGIATACKYVGVLVALPITGKWVWDRRFGNNASSLSAIADNKRISQYLRELGIGWLVMLVAFWLFNPYLPWSWERFLDDMKFQWWFSSQIEPLFGAQEPRFIFFLLGPLMWGCGLLLLVAGSVGLALVGKSNKGWMVLYVVVNLLVISLSKRGWGRWILPVVGWWCLGAAYLMTIWTQRFSKIVSYLVGILLLLSPGLRAIRCNYLLTRPDTRTIAYQWLCGHLPKGSKILLFALGPRLDEVKVPWQIYLEDDLLQDRRAFAAGLAFEPKIESLSDWKARGVNYVIINNFYLLPVYSKRAVNAYPSLKSYQEFCQELSAYANVFVVGEEDYGNLEDIFAPTLNLWGRVNPGPMLSVYQLE